MIETLKELYSLRYVLLNVFYIVAFCILIPHNTFFYRFLKFSMLTKLMRSVKKIDWTSSCAQHN